MTIKPTGRYVLPVIGAVLLAAVAIPSATGTASAVSSTVPGSAPSAPAAGPGKSSTVTLVTGDKVTVTTKGNLPAAISVVGPDGAEAAASITTVGDDTFVYPAAARPYLASGQIDQRLFNVTQLIADGYDDAHMDHVPLIVTYDSAAASRSAAGNGGNGLLRSAAEPADAHLLTSVDGVALAEDHDDVADFWKSLTAAPAASFARDAGKPAADGFSGGVAKVWLDGKAEALMADSTEQIGAPEVWQGGNTGEGVDVAVLDSGYDVEHPDLQNIASSESFVPDEDIDDFHGHGTHVASTIAGSGAASGGKERGVAPGARLHVGKVLDMTGSGQDSWILAGMEWAARDAKAKIISMSLGSDAPSDGTDLLSLAVDELSAETGALFTIAAGNAGPGAHTIGSPGTADAALTVGAVDSADALADFSSRGPRFADDGIKPEITAPGVDILAARSRNSWDGEGYYTTKSGTSMATPHVAGVAALLAAEHPDWTGAQLKDALVSTSKALPAIGVDDGGNGRVDAVAATRATLFATAAVDAGIHSLGGAPGETVDKTVEWTNTADSAVVVDLSTEASGAPEGLFTLSADRLTVPAHGSASATLTTHLDEAPAAHRFTSRVIGTLNGTVATRTLVGVSTQEKPYHLKMKLLDQQGNPVVGNTLVELLRQGGGDYAYSYAGTDNGVIDTVVAPGTYAVWSLATVKGTHGASSEGLGLLDAPSVEVHQDTELVLGGAALHEARAVTPRPATPDNQGRVDYIRVFDSGEGAMSNLTVGTRYDSVWLQQAPKVTDGNTLVTLRWRKKQPVLSVTSGSQNLDDLWVAPGSGSLPPGDSTVDAVFAVDGLADDYAALGAGKAQNKAVVVRQSDDEDDADEQITEAENAGVKLLLIVKNGNGRLYDAVKRTKVAVAGITASSGNALVARIGASTTGTARLRIASHPDTDYLYDLVKSWKDRIPADVTYAPKERELAKVEVDFRNDPTHSVDEYRFDIQPYATMRSGVTALSTAGAHRTDYVTTDSSFRWYEETYEYAPKLGPQSLQGSELIEYPAGRTTEVTWFGPFQRPRVNTSIDLPTRTGSEIAAYVPGWGDSGENHAGTAGYGPNTQTTELYRNGKLDATTDGGYLYADVPDAKASYRLVTTTARTGDYPLSTSTRTEWTFESKAAMDPEEVGQLPLIQLDYDLDTAADGSAKRNAPLLVTPSHLPGGPKASLRTTAVELSYDDGAHWHKTSVRSTSKGASVRLDAPRGTDYVTVRVHATDSRGNTVTQTIVRAAGIA
ncbi:S8 family serine peptidase [Streptomyces sp. NBC_00102]|uniref:S8 family serine peptidase n=1 Tax=Streptomyces sp. NBC_00102 TaxID=2975652 RepID=UPI00225621BC|nr:S8 family serine peptidase [Streptomyces sp. NBC_00102]MCX5401869.1 S8 family serine peptidase [Streptomyces sp. NBC_00102]